MVKKEQSYLHESNQDLNQIEAKLVNLIKSSDPIKSGELWRNLHSTFTEMICESPDRRGARVPELLGKLRNLHEECKRDMSYWDEVWDTLDKRSEIIAQKKEPI